MRDGKVSTLDVQWIWEGLDFRAMSLWLACCHRLSKELNTGHSFSLIYEIRGISLFTQVLLQNAQ